MKCKHEHATLCGRFDPDAGTFVAYQCDDCGAILRRDVPDDELYRLNLPPLDMEAASDAVYDDLVTLFPNRVEATAVDFFARALKK